MTEARKIGPLTIRPEVIQGEKTGRWFLDIPASLTSNGKRKRRRYPSRSAAEATGRELKRKMELRKLGYADAPETRGLPFSEAVERWDEMLGLAVKTGELRASSLRTIRTRLKPLLSHFGQQSVTGINVDEIKRYQVRRIDAPRKPVTINGELRVLRQLLGWLVERGELPDIPKVPKLAEQRRWLDIPTEEEIVRLLDTLRPSTRVLVWLMAETGLRPDEARHLPWAHVIQDQGAIRIAAHHGWKPKTKASDRDVYPSDSLMGALLSLPRAGEYVFSGKDSRKPIQNVRSALATAAKKAGLSRDGRPLHLTVKLFRKAFATIQAERGVNQSVVGSMMGHAPGSKMTEQFYTFVRDEAKRQNRLCLLPPEAA